MPREKPTAFVSAMSDQRRWAEDAACGDDDATLFDTTVSYLTEGHGRERRNVGTRTEITDENQVAMDICADCPVMMRCLEHAIRYDHRTGVWGGMVYEQRIAWALAHRPDWLPESVREKHLAVAA